jgi:hypothetical protein
MIRNTIRCLAVVWVVLLAGGCSDDSGVPTHDPSKTGSPSTALELWADGDEPGAREEFLDVNWVREDLLLDDPAFTLTQGELDALPASDKQEMHRHLAHQVGQLAELAGAVLDDGEQAGEVGNAARARACVDAVAGCGYFLQRNPDRAVILIRLGEAFVRRAGRQRNQLAGR